MSKFTPEQAQAYREERKARASELIEGALTQLTDPAYWSAYLTRGQSLARYSIRNQLLIGMQAPDASDVAGYVEWQGRGRQVRAGETGIMIFAPVTARKSAEAETSGEPGEDGPRKIRGVTVKSVFDITQTDAIEGKPFKPAVSIDPRTVEEIRQTITALAGDHAAPILEALERAGELVAA